MTQITLQLPEDLYQHLRATAVQSGTPLDQTIVAVLTQALAQQRPEAEPETPLQRPEVAQETPLERERRLVKEALGDLVVEIDPKDFAPFFTGRADLPSRQEIFDSMPILDPPLSRTIIEEREDRV